jgi:hypothetical protein
MFTILLHFWGHCGVPVDLDPLLLGQAQQLSKEQKDMSEIASLEKLELHLSYAPGYRMRGQSSSGSALEAFFSEIKYSSFEKARKESNHALHTSAKPQKNGAASYQLKIR